MTTHHNLDFAHNTDTNTSTSIKMMAPMIAITYTAHSGRGKSALGVLPVVPGVDVGIGDITVEFTEGHNRSIPLPRPCSIVASM